MFYYKMITGTTNVDFLFSSFKELKKCSLKLTVYFFLIIESIKHIFYQKDSLIPLFLSFPKKRFLVAS